MNKQLKARLGRLCYWVNDPRLTPLCHKLFKEGYADALDARNPYVRGILEATEHNLSVVRERIRNGDLETAREILASVLWILVTVAEQQDARCCA